MSLPCSIPRSPSSPLVPWLLLACALGDGCSCSHPPPIVVPDGCNPLGFDVDCGTPYPSDFFLVTDRALPSGKRVQSAGAAKMVSTTGASADVHEFWPSDGFSRTTPIVFGFGVEIDGASLPGVLDDPARTTKAGFATALIDADTGRRLAHFIDADPRALDDDGVLGGAKRQALVMTTLDRLKEKTRYIVAISGIKAAHGALPISEGFRRLRDRDVGDDDKILSPLSARFEEQVFPQIEQAGIERASLQLAFDFTTGSDDNATHDLLGALEQARAALPATPDGFALSVDSVLEGDALALVLSGKPHPEDTWRIVKGTLTGPRVVADDVAGTVLSRDDAGDVIVDGTLTFPWTLTIPASARDSFAPAPVVLFGHGFFGDRSEVEDDAARALADSSGVALFAIDWQGMSVDDIGYVVTTVGGEVSLSLQFLDRVVQAMANWQTLTTSLKQGAFTDAAPAALLRPSEAGQPGVIDDPENPGTTNAGLPILDVDAPIGFIGISQGHVLGGTLAAVNPDVERAVLMVGGASFSTMMYRARPFTRFLFLLDISLPDALEQRKLAAHMQSQFDRIDPAMYAPFVLQRALPGAVEEAHARRRLLVLEGIGDAQVPNVATELHARILGVPLLLPAPAADEVYGLDTAEAPLPADGEARGAMARYDLGVDPSFYAVAEPGEVGNDVHEGLRRTDEARAQVRALLRDGDIINPCDGPCVVDIPVLP